MKCFGQSPEIELSKSEFQLLILGVVCVTITNTCIMHRALAQKVGGLDLNLLFLIQSSLSCITWRHAGHGLEYGSPISNHATRQAYQPRAQVYVDIFISMLLLWYTSVQRMQPGITVMIKFH